MINYLRQAPVGWKLTWVLMAPLGASLGWSPSEPVMTPEPTVKVVTSTIKTTVSERETVTVPTAVPRSTRQPWSRTRSRRTYVPTTTYEVTTSDDTTTSVTEPTTTIVITTEPPEPTTTSGTEGTDDTTVSQSTDRPSVTESP